MLLCLSKIGFSTELNHKMWVVGKCFDEIAIKVDLVVSVVFCMTFSFRFDVVPAEITLISILVITLTLLLPSR